MMLRRVHFCGLACLMGVLVGAQEQTPLATAVAKARRDIQDARRELAASYEQIAEEKAELMSTCESLEQDSRELRSQRTEVLERMVERRSSIESARQSAQHLQDLSRYVANMVLEYRRAFETRLTAAQAEALQTDLQGVDRMLDEEAEEVTPEALEKMLSVSFRRCETALGGETFPGEALDVDGLTLRGTYMTFGPLTFFNEEQGETVGLAVQQVGSVVPTVFTGFDEPERIALQTLFESGTARVPVDVTMGSGVRLRETRESVTDHLRKGGVIMVPLLLLGTTCLLIVCYKLIVVSTLPTARSQRRVLSIIEALNHGEVDRARTLTRKLRRPLRSVISEGIEHRQAAKEHLEEILYEQILAQVPALERFLSPLAVCASAAPLLGLLGTVTGMIHTFRLITVFGTGDARLLSAGISEALITTEVGLMIAIPALLFHAYLSRRVRRTVGMAQEVSLTFVNGVKLKGNGQP